MTRTEPVIGVLGGYGAVGAAAARCLADWGAFLLRIGGRDAEAAARCASSLGGRAEPMAVDVMDDDSLDRFGRGCDVVLNCAGPAYILAERPRRAAAAPGAAYVDVMDGSGPGRAPDGERTAVLSAGVSPGLSGLLPRLLAEGPVPLRAARFTGYYVMLGAFTHTGAVDYLLSLDRDYGVARAQWRDGRVVRGALGGAQEREVAGVGHPVTVYPYLTRELVGQARALGLAEARWYNAFDGHRLLDALNRHRAGDGGAGSLDAGVAGVVRASTLDALGRTPYHLLWGVLEGSGPDGAPVRRTALIRGDDGSAMTGTVGAVAVRELAEGRIPPGTHRAAHVLPARAVTDALRRHQPGTAVVLSEGPADDEAAAGAGAAAVMEDGVL
ncbi:saccharopine dehydrogenase NADP-binding domain-containing protein [Streptomyces xantholiticus]